MRISIPNRFNLNYVGLFIALIFIGQGLEGTNFIFSLLTAAFIAAWALTYNLSGGVQYPSGAFILVNGLISVVIAVAAKVVLLQPGDRNLLAPTTTMICYTLGMVMMAIVMFLVRNLRLKTPIINSFDTLAELKRASIVCFVAGMILTVLLSRGGRQEGTLLSALSQINYFPMLAVLFATSYEIKASGGKRSVNWVVVAAVGSTLLQGLVYFGKTSMLLGFLAWGVAASMSGYNFKRKQLILLSLGFAFIIYYLVPYSQYVRNFGSKTGSAVENIPIAISYLSDLNGTRQLYVEAIKEVDIGSDAHFFDEREGFLDRLLQIAADDQLIDYTNRGNIYGMSATFDSYLNLVPHFIWHNKPVVNPGNSYGHEVGILAEEDFTTGLSYTPAADAFHQATWLGVLLLVPINVFLVFIILDSVVGSAKYSMFAMCMIVQMSVDAGSGGVVFGLHDMTYGVLGLLLVAWITQTVTPFVVRVMARPMISA